MTHTLSTPDLMAGIPRGLSTKYLKDQHLPQARWLTQEALLKHTAFHYDPDNVDGMILIGAIGGQLIGIRDDRHCQTTAGNRSGKSVCVAANLMYYNGSAFIIDPKGEHATRTAARRAAMGQKVVVLDPFGRAKGGAVQFRGRINPLHKITLDNDTAIEDAMAIVDGLIMTSGQEADPHWNETAGELLLGLILYVRFTADLADEDRTLVSVRKVLKDALKATPDGASYALPLAMADGVQRLREAGAEDIAEAMDASIRGLYEKSEDERSSVLSTAKRHTAFLDYRGMRDVLSGHDFDLAELKRRPEGMTVYICLPATRMAMCARWMRIIVNQLIDAMEAEETVPKAPVLAVLDEFPVLGHMKQLEIAAGQVASFHLKLWTILQDWSQGQAIYRERWESFAANCGWTQWFANADLTTTEYVSKRLGKTPVQTTRQGDTSYDQVEKGQAGRSMALELHDLLRPVEVAKTFGRDDPQKRQLIQYAGLNPMILQRIEYWREDTPYYHHFKGKWEA